MGRRDSVSSNQAVVSNWLFVELKVDHEIQKIPTATKANDIDKA
jgi:hypothetical protein